MGGVSAKLQSALHRSGLVASCKTIPIPQNPPIPVPPGLTEEQVGVAIIAAALEPPNSDPQWFNAFVTNNAMTAGVWQSMHESGDS